LDSNLEDKRLTTLPQIKNMLAKKWSNSNVPHKTERARFHGFAPISLRSPNLPCRHSILASFSKDVNCKVFNGKPRRFYQISFHGKMLINKDVVMAVNIVKLLYICIRSRIACYACGGSLRDVGTCLTKFTAPHTSEIVQLTRSCYKIPSSTRPNLATFIYVFHAEDRKAKVVPTERQLSNHHN
jgi:hypothetical protein